MTTDTSPIFGLTLTGIIELDTILGILGSITASCIIARTIKKGNEDQMELQKKVESFKLAFEWSKKWECMNKFTHVILLLEKPSFDFTNESRGDGDNMFRRHNYNVSKSNARRLNNEAMPGAGCFLGSQLCRRFASSVIVLSLVLAYIFQFVPPEY